jgi:hypothetical protein
VEIIHILLCHRLKFKVFIALQAKVTKGDGGGRGGRHGSTIHNSEESGMSDLSDISSSDGETDGDF